MAGFELCMSSCTGQLFFWWFHYLCLVPFPSQVVDVSTSKTGKHGHAKCHFVAIDIFTGKKMEDLCPSSHNAEVPHVNRADLSLLSIDDEGFVSTIAESAWKIRYTKSMLWSFIVVAVVSYGRGWKPT